jgi:peptidoglycan/LPS O-acetylase OafA/YrhL
MAPTTGPAATAATRRAPERLAYLDGLRALAALWVLANHTWLTIYPSFGTGRTPGGLLGLATTWMAYGHFAVVAFIVLSGFSLSIATANHEHRLPGGLARFLRRRFVRILLPYWGALLLSVALATTVLRQRTGTHWDSALPVTGRGVMLHLLVLQDVASPAQINHALWSIAIEWHIYFLFPLLLALRRRLGLLGSTALVFAVGLVISAQFGGGLTMWAEANLVGCFALGMAAREVVLDRGALRIGFTTMVRPPWLALALGVALGLIALSQRLGTERAAEQSNTLLEPLVGLGMAALLVAVGRSPTSRLRRPLEARWLVFIGSFSYSVYLLHAPVLQLLWQYLMRPLGLPLRNGWALALLLGLGLASSLLVGWCYFLLVEQRCLRARPPGPRARKHRPKNVILLCEDLTASQKESYS